VKPTIQFRTVDPHAKGVLPAGYRPMRHVPFYQVSCPEHGTLSLPTTSGLCAQQRAREHLADFHWEWPSY
jgi:hypothetical protein